MAACFGDGFDSGDLATKWLSAPSDFSILPTGGRYGGPGLRVSGSVGNQWLQAKQFISYLDNSASCQGFWFKASTKPAAATPLFAIVNSANSGITPAAPFGFYRNSTGGMQVNPDGTISQTVGNQAWAAAPPTFNVCDGQWHWIEAYFGSHQSPVTNWSVYIDTIAVIAILANGQSNNAADHMMFYSTAGWSYTIDDCHHYNFAAGAPNSQSFPIGPLQCTTCRPSADQTVQFTTATPNFSHAQNVNFSAPQQTAYNQDGTIGHTDLFAMSALGGVPQKIIVVYSNAYLDNPAGGTINYAHACKSGTANVTGPATPTPTQYTTEQAAWPVDPNSNAAWTYTAFSAANFGYAVVA
jgi:hypothetical protein